MKKAIFLLSIAMCCIFGGSQTASAQSGMYIHSPKRIVTGGDYNSSTFDGGSETKSDVIARDFSVFPLYSSLNAVSDASLDTASQKIASYCNSVYTWAYVSAVTGTNTSCVLTLEVSGDYGAGINWQPIQTYTLSGNDTSYGHVFTGWPYTNFRWRFTGIGTHATAWYCGFMPR